MLSEILHKYDYDTALIGKWHLGVHREQVPSARGFDYQYGFYGASSLYTPKENWSGVINHKQESFSAQHQWKTGRKDEAAILRNGKEIIEERYLTDAFRDEMMPVHGGAQGRAILHLRRVLGASRALPGAGRVLLHVPAGRRREQAGVLRDDLVPR